MDFNKFRNCINNLINWEWNFLKKLKKKRSINILLRGSFIIFSFVSILFCVFVPPFILLRLFIYLGFPKSLIDWARIISFFIWLWFISPSDNLSKKEREGRNKGKLEVVKALQKASEAYEKKFK